MTKKQKTVGDCVLETAISCKKHHSVSEVAQKLKKNDSRYLLVVEGKNPIGIVSVTDIAMKAIAEGKNPKTTPVHKIMTSPVFILKKDEPLDIAIIAMMKKELLHCPVVNSKNECVGLANLNILMDEQNGLSY